MESQEIINQIHDAFGNADNTIIRQEILNQFTGLDSEVAVFYGNLGKKSWVEFTNEDIEKISSTPDVQFYYCPYPMFFILPAFMIKSVRVMEQPELEVYCLIRSYVLSELKAMTATLEEFKQELMESNTQKDMVEFYLEKQSKGGQEKLEALTAKQKAACTAYLMYTAEKFENVYLPQLEGSEIHWEAENEYHRIKVFRDRFIELIK